LYRGLFLQFAAQSVPIGFMYCQYLLELPQEGARHSRLVPITLQLGDQIPLARDMFFTFGYVPFGQSEVIKQHLSVHGS
jgi:hypothetical protein